MQASGDGGVGNEKIATRIYSLFSKGSTAVGGEGFMRLHYQKHPKPFSQKLRKQGNLAEVILWNELKSDKLGYRFLRQRPIGKYIVDFFCHTLRLVVEIDGSTTHDTKIEKDIARQKELEALRVNIIRFRDSDVRYNLAGVIESIKKEILRLTPPPLKKEE